MADTSVSMEILVETRKAVQLIEGFTATAKQSFGDLKGSIDKASQGTEDLGKSFAKLGNPLAALKVAAGAFVGILAGREVLDFFKEGVEAASKQEVALSSLAAQMSLTGDATEESIQVFKEFADEMERTTGVDDDVVISQAAVAKSFGVTDKQAQELVKAAIELSASGFGDLNTSVKALGKTFTGTTGKLDEQIPVLKSLTKEQLAHGEAIDIVLERYGGAAEAKLDNFAGSLTKAGNAFGNFREAAGDVIVSSPAVRAAIDGLADSFRDLEGWVVDNKDTLHDLVRSGLQIASVGMAVAVDTAGLLIGGFQRLGAAADVTQALIASMAEGIVSNFGNAVDAALRTVEAVVNLADSVPLVSAGFDAAGISLDGASESVRKAREDFKDFSTSTVEGITEYKDAVRQSYVQSFDSFEATKKQVDAVSGAFVDLGVKIGEATAKSVANAAQADKSNRAYKDFGSGLTQTAAEMKKASDELAKQTDAIAEDIAKQSKDAQEFLRKVTFAALDESDKILAKREEDLGKLESLVKGGFLSPGDAAAAAAAIEQIASDGLDNVSEKMADELRKGVEDASKDPIKFLVDKLEIQPAALDGLEEGIGAAIGGLGSVLKGAAGAKDLISQGAGAFADAFLPGIGPAVTGVIGQLAQGPEATKAFVKEFVKSVPEIIEAIAESAPVVVEALVDSLINEGGIVRIALAFAKALSGEAILKNIGKQIGIDMGNAFNADTLAKKFGDGVKIAFREISQITSASIRDSFQAASRLLLIEFPAKVSELFFVKLPEALRSGFTAGAQAIGAAFAAVPGMLTEFFTQAVPNAFSSAGASFISAFTTTIPETFNTAIENLKSSISGSLKDLTKGITDSFNGVFEPMKKALSSFKFPELPKFTWPKLPSFTWPDFPKLPTDFFSKLSLPKFATDLFSKLNLPSFGSNIFSDLKLPEFDSNILSNLKLPEFVTDLFSKLSLPTWSWPEIPTPGWLEDLKKVTGGGGGGGVFGKPGDPGRGPVTGIKGSPFAKGGRVPPGFPKDSYFGALTSDEEVLDRSLSADLRAFLADERGSASPVAPVDNGTLSRILAAIEKLATSGAEQPLMVNLQVGEAQLAKAILSLNRQGFRVA